MKERSDQRRARRARLRMLGLATGDEDGAGLAEGEGGAAGQGADREDRGAGELGCGRVTGGKVSEEEMERLRDPLAEMRGLLGQVRR